MRRNTNMNAKQTFNLGPNTAREKKSLTNRNVLNNQQKIFKPNTSVGHWNPAQNSNPKIFILYLCSYLLTPIRFYAFYCVSSSSREEFNFFN